MSFTPFTQRTPTMKTIARERGLYFKPRTVRNADEILAVLEQAY